ncbi:putative membrane protein [Streptacidiphilus sp. MAP12-16]|uniref:PH domain-containing protein n=1 Tax=Streptacidiphilus sp. MAP12-16 TaxID=3156300 RepID=UPI0035184AC7
MTAGTVAVAPGWQRLSARLIPVHLSWLAVPVVSTGITVLGTGGKLNLQAYLTLSSLTLAFLIVSGVNLMRYLTTGYRITDSRLELRSGLLFRSSRSIPLDRIRSADVTAHPVHRLFGLASVSVGAAVQGGSSNRKFSLDGVTATQAGDLRDQLLNRRNALNSGEAAAVADDAPIAEIDWSWIRYAPLTIWGVGGLFAVVGVVYRTLHDAQIDPLKLGVVHDVVNAFGSVPLWVGILLLVLVIVALGVIGSIGIFVEGWHGFRLEREDGGILRVRRGLLISRSVSVEERRLRGVEVVEPMLLRWGGGARLHAVATGLGSAEENRTRGALMPPSPRAEVLRVAAAVMGQEKSPTVLAELRPHPRVALRRRLNRGAAVVVFTAVLVAVPGLWVPGFLQAAWITAAVLLPAVILLALDAYRTLAHGITGRYLVARSGTFAHRTVALQCEGVIGWTVSSSIFQRRSGLLTLTASTAAGRGAYRIRDVTVTEGLAFAEEAVPGLLAPFVERG